MNDFLKKYWVLLLTLSVFIFLKIPHLSYPYYWDESWPYAPAIKQMLHHGISLMPGSVEAELSRGHPLFFHAIAAMWMKVFGDSHFAMHSFALTISILFLIAIYEAGLRSFNQRVATMALLLVVTQVVFFIQSSFVLFEMLVAFLCFLSLYFYSRGRYLLTALCLSMLFYTKESGLIAGFVIGIYAIVEAFNGKIPARERIYKLLSVGVPCVLIGIFFLMQKYVMGWYIFPFYSSIIEHSWPAFWYKFRMASVRVTLHDDQKFLYFDAVALIAIATAIKNKNLRYLTILLPLICTWYFVDDMRAGRLLPPIPFFITYIVVCGYFLYTYSSAKLLVHKYQQKLLVLMGAFIFCFMCFSTMNFFTYRYMLAAIVPALFIVAILMDIYITHIHRALYIPVLVILLSISVYSISQNDNYGDCDFGAFNGIALQQGTVDYLEQHNYYDKVIGSGSFLEICHLNDPATGFLRSAKTFKHASWYIDANTEIAVFNSLEYDKRYEFIKNDPAFQRIYRQTRGSGGARVWAEIYMRRRN